MKRLILLLSLFYGALNAQIVQNTISYKYTKSQIFDKYVLFNDTIKVDSVKLLDGTWISTYRLNKLLEDTVDVSRNSLLLQNIDTSWIKSLRLYSGINTEPTFTDNGNGTCTLGSAVVTLYTTTNFTGVRNTYTVSGGTFTISASGASEYIVANYNSGNPVMQKVTDATTINGSNIRGLYTVWRQGGVIHSLSNDADGNGVAERVSGRIRLTEPYKLTTAGGLVVSEITSPNPRTISITQGYVYSGIVINNVLAFNSSTDTLTKATVTNGTWTYTNELVYNNTDYNPSTGPVAMNANKYSVRWFYRSIGDVKQTFYVMGSSEYNSAAEAESDPQPTINSILRDHCMLVAKAIIKKSATSGYIINLLGVTNISYTAALHSSLGNLDYASSGHTEFAGAVNVLPTNYLLVGNGNRQVDTTNVTVSNIGLVNSSAGFTKNSAVADSMTTTVKVSRQLSSKLFNDSINNVFKGYFTKNLRIGAYTNIINNTFSAPVTPDGISDGERIQLFTGAGQKTAIGMASDNGIWLQSHGGVGMRAFEVYSGAVFGAPISRLCVVNNGRTGVNTIAPGASLDINSADGGNLRLTYNDADGAAANYTDITTGSDGDLSINSTGGQVYITDQVKITHTSTPQIELEYDGSNDAQFTVSSDGNLTISPSGGKIYKQSAVSDSLLVTKKYVDGKGVDTSYIKFKGTENAFVGYQSGKTTVGVGYNAFFGSNSGKVNTSGTGNTFIGSYAGFSNVTTSYNTHIGTGSGQNSTASKGTYVGRYSGLNSKGDNNTYIGLESGYGNSSGTGSSNTAIGYQTARNNKDGTSNFFGGSSAGFNNTDGNYNVYIGSSSGYNQTTGGGNTYIGSLSGVNQVAGDYNTYLGYYSGLANITGSSNIYIGYNVQKKKWNSSNILLIDNRLDSISTFIAGDMSADTLRVNAQTRIGKGNNYVSISPTGTLTLNGTATVYDDLMIDLNSLKTLGSVDKPDYDKTNLTYDFPQNDTTEILGKAEELPHSWAEGDTIWFHVHFDQTQNLTPVFNIVYKIYNRNESEPTVWSKIVSNGLAYSYTSGTQANMITFPGVVMTGKTLSCIMKIKLYRNDNVYTGDCKVTRFAIHYKIDKLGSNNMASN